MCASGAADVKTKTKTRTERPASFTFLFFTHSVASELLAIAEPHPNVLNTDSSMTPSLLTLICNFITYGARTHNRNRNGQKIESSMRELTATRTRQQNETKQNSTTTKPKRTYISACRRTDLRGVQLINNVQNETKRTIVKEKNRTKENRNVVRRATTYQAGANITVVLV